METYKLAILELCLEKELLLAEIYRIFAERFPQHKLFWEGLAAEETEHAGWVRFLQQQSDKSQLTFDEGKVKTYTVKTFIDYLRSVLMEARLPRFTFDKALAFTLDAERALLERNVYAGFQSRSSKDQQLLKLLQQGIHEHVSKVEEYARKHQRKV